MMTVVPSGSSAIGLEVYMMLYRKAHISCAFIPLLSAIALRTASYLTLGIFPDPTGFFEWLMAEIGSSMV